MTDAISALSPTTTTAAQDDRTTLAGDFDTFLILLTEQLQNQDPLEPLDSNQFVSQLVEFSSVEQQIKQNSNLEDLLAGQSASVAASAVSFVGRDAALVGDAGQLSGGEAEWRYTLVDPARSVTLTVRDARERIVFETNGQTGEGAHNFVWDGRDGDGALLEDGLYTLEVSAENAEGGPIDVVTAGFRRIDGVDFSGAEAAILVAGQPRPLSDIAELRAGA